MRKESSLMGHKQENIWSWVIGILLIISTVAIWIVIILVGCDILNFQKYPWFLHTVIGTFFAQVVGLALVVAKYLFSSNKQ